MACLITREPGELTGVFQGFLKKKERVLICLPEMESGIGAFFAQMVESCGGVPVFWGKDLRWKALLRKGFAERCGTVIGPPGVVLGLSKLAKQMGTPLYIHNAVLIGEEPDRWMLETIQQGLDCRVWACCLAEQEPEEESIVALRRDLRRWTSILDFRLKKGAGGLSLEMLVFPGEKLPKLPSLGRLSIREWDPEADVPYDMASFRKMPEFS